MGLTIQVYHQIYQTGLIATLIMLAITILLFFVFRIYKIISDITGRTKRREEKLREVGASVSIKPRQEKTARKSNGRRDTRQRREAKQNKPGSKSRDLLNTVESVPTEALNAVGSAPTEVLSTLANVPTEVLNTAGNSQPEFFLQTEMQLKEHGSTEILKQKVPVQNMNVTVIQEILLMHSEEIVMVI